MNIFMNQEPQRVGERSPKPDEIGVEETFFTHSGKTPAYIGVALNQRRLKQLQFVVLVLVVMMLARAIQLQVFEHALLGLAADRNRLRTEYIPAQRGIITDRNNTELVENIASFSLIIIPSELPPLGEESNRLYDQLSQEFEIDPATLTTLDAPDTRLRAVVALPVFLTHEQAIAFTLKQEDFPGVRLQVLPTRQYLSTTPSLSHVLGYVGYPNASELNTRSNLLSFTLIGKSGIEQWYDDRIRGTDGNIQWEYNSQGQRQRKISQTPPIQGAALKTTLDLPLQQAAEAALKQELAAGRFKSGSAIVERSDTGAVLSLVSLPTFSSNSFTLPSHATERNDLLKRTDRPLFFRGIAGQYPSGSVIKPFIAATALNNGIITEQTSVLSTGGIRIGEYFFPDWKPGGHGVTSIRKALAESINTFFYLVVGGDLHTPSLWPRKELGVDALRAGLERFGWGMPSGIDLPNEEGGFIPDPQWKLKTKKERWFIGDTYHMAIGQGDILVTPLQIATATARIASGGRSIQPWIVESPREPPKVMNFSNNAIEIVTKGMRDAVAWGSARRLNDLPFPVYAKTGTAQTGSQGHTHSWLTSFATVKKTPIVVTVLVEEGGEGSGPALTVAKKIYQALYTNTHF